MSTTSIARQNRRLRHKQLPALLSPNPVEFPTGELINQELSSTGCSFVNCDVTSQPIGKVFLEEERGFKVIDANHMNGRFQQDESPKKELAIGVALKAAQLFQNLSFFFHGMLGGMSFVLLLTHLITNEIIKNFSFLTQPFHNIYNFMCIICCISTFDRYDIGNVKNMFKYIKKCCLNFIIISIYPICLLMSLSTVNVDEKLWIASVNSTEWHILTSKDSENEIFYWKTLSILKYSGALIGWIVLCCNPNHNTFISHLEAVNKKSNIK